MMFVFSKVSEDRLSTVCQELQDIANLAITITCIDFGIPSTGGLRSVADQQKLFAAGKSAADGLRRISKHQLGKALDVYAVVNGKPSWEPEHLAMVACAMLQAASMLRIKIRWGGHFKPYKNNHGWDMPHFEVLD